MTHDEARFILQARRPHGADDAVPPMAEALAVAGRDPALGAWLAREEKFDGTVTHALRQVAPPAALRAAILAGVAAQETNTPWWRRPTWLALAASVALVAGAFAFGPFSFSPVKSGVLAATAPLTIEQLHELAVADTRNPHSEAVPARLLGELGRWLENPTQRLTVGLPFDFPALQALGCRHLSLAGRDILEICFERDQTYHLFIARRQDFTPESLAHEPVLLAQDDMSTAVWTRGDLIYVLAAKAGTDSLTQLL